MLLTSDLERQEQEDLANRSRLEHLWWIMHHSDDPNRITLALTSYLDDSGSDDLSPLVAIGGPVMAKQSFATFGEEWSKILRLYRIPPPFHMKDFVRPFGKHIGVGREMKLALFSDVAKIINAHKLYSISVTIPQVKFRELLSPEVCRNLISPYGLAFFCTVLANRVLVDNSKLLKDHKERIAYVVDCGSPYAEHLRQAHAVILSLDTQHRDYVNVGAMAFDIDDCVAPLQASDVIAWSARRQHLGKLTEEFQPLENVLLPQQAAETFGKVPPHASIHVSAEAIKEFAISVNTWITEHGALPSLVDVLRR